jgi:hypothetical protein
MFVFRSGSVYIKKNEASKSAIMAFLLLFLIMYLFISSKIVWLLYVLFALLVVTLRNRLTFEPLTVLLALGLPLVLTLTMSFDDGFIQAVKGFFYLSVPLIMIFTGFQLKKLFTAEQFFTYLSVIGTIIALVFIVLTLVRVGFIAFISPYTEARFSVGSGSPACIFGLVIALFSEKFGIIVFRKKKWRILTIIINLIAIYLFASRTFWFILLIFILLFSVKTLKKSTWLIMGVVFLSIVLLLAISTSSAKGLTFSNSLLFKFVNSLSEIRISEFKTDRDINSFYRGFETYRSWKTYTEGNIPELLFGGGFGKMIELKAEVLLAGEYWTRVPLVHNGFFFVLVKEGAIGLISVILFFLVLIDTGLRNFRAKQDYDRFMSVFLLSGTVALFISNFVGCGMYTLEMTLLMITIGFLLQALYKRNSKYVSDRMAKNELISRH